MAPTAFLDLKMDLRPPKVVENKYEAFQAHQHDFGCFQRDTGAALPTILFTKQEYRALRTSEASRVRRRVSSCSHSKTKLTWKRFARET